MKRFISFLVLIGIGFAGPWWLFVAGLLLYGYLYGGMEIVALAVLVDALFMSSVGIVPFYTLGTIAGLIGLELVKPHLVLYNQE